MENSVRKREEHKILVSKYLIELGLKDNIKNEKLRDVLIPLNEFVIEKDLDFPIVENILSWKDLHSYLQLLGMTNFFNIKNPNESKSVIFSQTVLSEGNCKDNESDFFQSKEAEFIYYLTNLDGEIQREKLGIKPMLYNKKDYAKKWRNDILKEIHPDKSKHKEASKAIEVLNEIYAKMVK